MLLLEGAVVVRSLVDGVGKLPLRELDLVLGPPGRATKYRMPSKPVSEGRGRGKGKGEAERPRASENGHDESDKIEIIKRPPRPTLSVSTSSSSSEILLASTNDEAVTGDVGDVEPRPFLYGRATATSCTAAS